MEIKGSVQEFKELMKSFQLKEELKTQTVINKEGITITPLKFEGGE